MADEAAADGSTPGPHADQTYTNQLESVQPYSAECEEIVQVVYQSNQNGSLIGVESSLIDGQSGTNYANYVIPTTAGTMAASSGAQVTSNMANRSQNPPASILQQQIPRVSSTLPSVAEESSNATSGGQSTARPYSPGLETSGTMQSDMAQTEKFGVMYTGASTGVATNDLVGGDPIYSTINKRPVIISEFGKKPVESGVFSPSSALSSVATDESKSSIKPDENNNIIIDNTNNASQTTENQGPIVDAPPDLEPVIEQDTPNTDGGRIREEEEENRQENQDEGRNILFHQKQGAAESGSFRRNHHKKKLGLSISTNENDLMAHRQKFIEAHESNVSETSAEKHMGETESDSHLTISKFKRTHSVSFNVNSSRSNRHSVDIRNLPSYLTHKRTSIVDVAKGAMSSLISSFGGGGGGSANASVISASHHRRDSSPEEEPIFEEPIAPTLSLGQRVALVRESGAEFGTVGWIGQLPDIDDDWIVGVIFDNMIGNCDGAYNGVRYFYAQENYAMFVPLSLLTKTDNYIGRPETGTMLSRMSIQLKPGQLISIQRSSIRLQHCFLNAPHQRVGHDVRAVSNRLHCQCHNCGPCAHLTKQGRPFVLPHFGSHHIPHKSKNSLARAAVELLAHHHHHHFHDEEEHHEDEEDCRFGENSAHACNYVRYSCCKQSGTPGHEFMNDCGMVRPELLDNLIHAPKAPHRRSHSRRRRSRKDQAANKYKPNKSLLYNQRDMIAGPMNVEFNQAAGAIALDSNQSTLDKSYLTDNTTPAVIESSDYMNAPQQVSPCKSSCASRSVSPERAVNEYYQYDSTMTTGAYNTIDSRVCLIDQQRYISQRDSSALMHSRESDYGSGSDASTTSLGSKILRCLGCLRQRIGGGRRRKRSSGRTRPRRLSARDRLIEYRRRQSTFVPSTLAKPHEDFASHGIIFPPPEGTVYPSASNNIEESNVDYYSYSSDSCSSRSSSPGGEGGRCRDHPKQQQQQVDVDQLAANIDQQLQMTFEQGKQSTNDMLKSGNIATNTEPDQPLFNYADYVSNSSYGSMKKSTSNQQESTDLGFSEAYTNYSSDTLKNLVDQSINQEVSLPEPIVEGGVNGHLLISPLESATGSYISDEPVEISSPTDSYDRHDHYDEYEEEGQEHEDSNQQDS